MTKPPYALPNPPLGTPVDPSPTEDTRPSARRRGIPDSEDLSGQEVQGYAFIKKLGYGGNSTVYEALCRRRRSLVAVKVLHRHIASDPVTARRFAQEIETVKLLAHDNVIAILDAGYLLDGRAFYVMERFDGVSLCQLVYQQGRLPVSDAVAILGQIVSGLAAAHALGIIHRDIKPANILVGRGVTGYAAKIIDFGIAKISSPDAQNLHLTADHVRVGSPVAMAPEQILGEPVDARTDLYAVGVVGFYLVTGLYPFRSDGNTSLERLHLSTPPPHAASLVPVPVSLDELLIRCMGKRPDERYQSAGELRDALDRVLDRPVRDRPVLPGSQAGELRQAVAVHVEVLLGADDSAGGERDEDEILRDADDILDAASQALTRAGFCIQVNMSSSFLATLLLPARDTATYAEAAVASLRSLYRSLRQGRLARQAASLVVCVGLAAARVAKQGEEDILAGGPILEGSWLPDVRAAGFSVVRVSGPASTCDAGVQALASVLVTADEAEPDELIVNVP